MAKSRRRVGGRTDKAESALSSGVSFTLDDAQLARVMEKFQLEGVQTGMRHLQAFGLDIAHRAVKITKALHGPFGVMPKVTRDDEALSVTVAYPRIRQRSHAILAKSLRLAADYESKTD